MTSIKNAIAAAASIALAAGPVISAQPKKTDDQLGTGQQAGDDAPNDKCLPYDPDVIPFGCFKKKGEKKEDASDNGRVKEIKPPQPTSSPSPRRTSPQKNPESFSR